jgi:hypothetical protein
LERPRDWLLASEELSMVEFVGEIEVGSIPDAGWVNETPWPLLGDRLLVGKSLEMVEFCHLDVSEVFS